MSEPTPGKGPSLTRRAFLAVAAQAGAAFALTSCEPLIQKLTQAANTASPPKDTSVPEKTPIIEKTPVPPTPDKTPALQYTPKPPESNSILPSTDTYPLFPEYDPALTDMSSEGLQKRFDKAVADKILTPIGKQDNLDKIDAQIRGVVYLQYRQEVGQRLFTDEKNQLEEMLSYAKDKKYDLIYSWNGEIGDKFQTIVTLTRTNEKGEKQIWWNGTKSGALYLRPDSFDTYETTSGYWVTTAASPVIQWKDDNTPIVFSEKSGDTPVRWFNPLAKSLSESNYLGEWQGLTPMATATPNAEATKQAEQADFEAKKAEALKMVSIKLETAADFQKIPTIPNSSEFDDGTIQAEEQWIAKYVLPKVDLQLPKTWRTACNDKTGLCWMSYNAISERITVDRAVSVFFEIRNGVKMLRIGVEYGGSGQLIHFNFEDPKWWTNPLNMQALIDEFNGTTKAMLPIISYGSETANISEKYNRTVAAERDKSDPDFFTNWIKNRTLDDGADRLVFDVATFVK